MSPIETILLHEKEFTKSEHKIKDNIISNPDIVACFPLMTAAYKMNVSKSALLRFCQKCGYDGFSEFKYEISRYLHSGYIYSDSIVNTSEEIIQLFINQLTILKDNKLDLKLESICSEILNAKKIKIYGIHETGLAAKHLQYRLTTLGVDSESVTDSSLIIEKSQFSSFDDINIYFSLSATTSLITESIDNALKKNSKIVLITQNNKSKYSKIIDNIVVLPTFTLSKSTIFIDSQSLNFILIELLVNKLYKLL